LQLDFIFSHLNDCFKGERIEWRQLRDFLNLAQRASKKSYTESEDDKVQSSRQTITLFYKFLTSKTGLFLKRPLVHEIAEAIDGMLKKRNRKKFLDSAIFFFLLYSQHPLHNILLGMASTGEANLMRISGGFIKPLPGGNGPVNEKRMEEIRGLLDMVQSAMSINYPSNGLADRNFMDDSADNNVNIVMEQGRERTDAIMDLLQSLIVLLGDEKRREEAAPIFAEIQSVIRMVTVEVLEIRGSRAIRNILGNS